MKFINPSVEYLPQPNGIKGVWHQIAVATRTCYMSEAREGESDGEFVKRVILKPALISGDLSDLQHCRFDSLKLHGGCLEHGTVYLKIPAEDYYFYKNKFNNRVYAKLFTTDEGNRKGAYYISTNMRYAIEHNVGIEEIEHFWCEPTRFHSKRYTFKVITDIGVTREMNRHRTFSICEQSTRYCDYTKGKFGSELTFIKPTWWNIEGSAAKTYCGLLEDIESTYKYLREDGWKPEQARQVLPLGLKTEAVYTAFAYDWRHFTALRADNASGKAHPNIQFVANEIKKKLEELQVIMKVITNK